MEFAKMIGCHLNRPSRHLHIALTQKSPTLSVTSNAVCKSRNRRRWSTCVGAMGGQLGLFFDGRKACVHWQAACAHPWVHEWAAWVIPWGAMGWQLRLFLGWPCASRLGCSVGGQRRAIVARAVQLGLILGVDIKC